MAARRNREQQRSLIVAHVAAGSSRRDAAALAGVPFSTFYEWMEYTKFAERLAAAEAEFERIAVERISRAAGQGSWKAALVLLERRLPNEWQQRSTLAVHEMGGDLSPEERSAVTLARGFRQQTDDERLVAFHESLRLSVLDLTPAALDDLRGFIGDLLAARHIGQVEPLPWERLSENVRGRRPVLALSSPRTDRGAQEAVGPSFAGADRLPVEEE